MMQPLKIIQNFKQSWNNSEHDMTAQYDEFKDEALWKKYYIEFKKVQVYQAFNSI